MEDKSTYKRIELSDNGVYKITIKSQENCQREGKFPNRIVSFVEPLGGKKQKKGFITAICDWGEFFIGEYENISLKDLGKISYFSFCHSRNYGSEGGKIKEGEMDVYILPGIYRFLLCLKLKKGDKILNLNELDENRFFNTTISINKINESIENSNYFTYLLKDKLFLHEHMSVENKIFRLFLSGRTFPVNLDSNGEKYYVFFINDLECAKIFFGKRNAKASTYRALLGENMDVKLKFDKAVDEIIDIKINNNKKNDRENENNIENEKKKLVNVIFEILGNDFIKGILRKILEQNKTCLVIIAKNIYESGGDNKKIMIARDMKIHYVVCSSDSGTSSSETTKS